LSSLETNIFEGQMPTSITCGALFLAFPKLGESPTQGSFIRDLHSLIRKNMAAYVHENKVYFLGKEEQLREDLEPLLLQHDDFKITNSSEVTLQLPENFPIIRSLLYYSFEDFVAKRGYAVRSQRGRDKIAIPSFEKMTYGNSEYKLVEYTASHDTTVQLIESFFYRLNITGNGKLNLVIDPKLQVLIPATRAPKDVLERSYLSVICLQDSDQAAGCQLLYRGSVKYVGPAKNEGLPNTKCVETAREFYQVFDVKRQRTLVLPANILFVEGHPDALDIFSFVRKRSLKSSVSRRNLTLSFAKQLAGGSEHIVIPFGTSQVMINSSPVVLKIRNTEPTGPLSHAKILGEPRLVFTNSPMYVNPREGLTYEGPYSRNNRSTSHHPESITLHAIYPKSYEQLVRDFIQRLVLGCTGYGGFSISAPPFFSEIKTAYYPLTNPNSLAYKSQVSTLRDKIEKRNQVVLVILPDSLESYMELKALCYQHGMASQFIKISTLKKALVERTSQFYLWNLAIGIYSKAGGIPWKIDSSILQHSDCYIGIQTKIQQMSRSTPTSFFVGAADIFNSFGEYISCAVHQGTSQSFDGLHVDSQFMKNLVVAAVDRYKTNVGLLPQKIVVHRQLEFDKNEIEGLMEGLEESGVRCPCILVHLQEGHHFRGYLLDTNDFVVDRTTYYPLGKKSVVLFTTGKVLGRYEGGLGTPKPTQINVRMLNYDGELTYKDIEEVCKSVIGFTRLRWNSTRVGIRQPLTIFAADRIGEMAKSGFGQLQYRDIRDFL